MRPVQQGTSSVHPGIPVVDEDDRVEEDDAVIDNLFVASGTAGWWSVAYFGMAWSKQASTATAILFGGLLYLMFEYSKSGEK
jgi:hypothetical protein